MGKKNNNNSRLSESESIAKDKKHKPFKRSVAVARQIHYYEKGKGSKGIHIRKPRVIKQTRKIIRELDPPTDKNARNTVIFKGFIDKTCAAVDGYGNRIMELAAEIAKNRKTKDAKGLKLKKKDLQLAYRWHSKLSNQ